MKDSTRFILLLGCFVLSGLAGLVYETAWTQQFALVFGTSELAVATVLAAYMAGLVAGAIVAARVADRLRRPVLVYACLELGIGLCALMVPWALGIASRLQVVVLGGLELQADSGSIGSALFYLGVSFVILFPATAMMGATLPLLARHAVRSNREIGSRVGILYAANTVGAALGTLLAAFVLLPRLGLGQTVMAAVGVNFTVFLLAVLLVRSSPQKVSERPGVKKGNHSGPAWILPLMMFSGFVALSYEVMWTRLLSHLLGGSIYAFAVMLASFLVGIALGSAVAARFAGSTRRSERGFAVAQLGVAVLFLLAFVNADRIAALSTGMKVTGVAQLIGAVSPAVLALLPGALFLGATFPFAVSILSGGDSRRIGADSALVLAWNTLGAIGGALATGFVFLPWLGFAGTAAVTVAISLILALVSALLARPRNLSVVAVAVLVGSLMMVWPPQTPWRVLRTSPLSGRSETGEAVFLGVGRSATVLVVERLGEWRLSTNGLPESAIEGPGARLARYSLARWLAMLPVLSRPNTESMMVVGLGAGLTVESVPRSVEAINVVELEPEVVRANHFLAEDRRRDPLADPRVELTVNDARSALLLDDRQYGAVVSQPSHPWTAGASHLFTNEFFALVRDRLEPGGVFAQWIGQESIDIDLLRSILASLVDVFPSVELYCPPPGIGLLFVASSEPLRIEEQAGRSLALNRDQWRALGMITPEQFVVSRVLDSEGCRRAARGAPPNTDQHNLLQVRSPRILVRPLGRRGAEKELSNLDPLLARAKHESVLVYVRLLLSQGSLRRAHTLAAAIEDPYRGRVARALVMAARGRVLDALGSLRAALMIPGDDRTEALSAFWLFGGEFLDAAGGDAELQARFLDDPAAAAVVEGRRLVKLRNPLPIAELEPRLAAVDPRHPLFEPAVRLRIVWRQASHDPDLAQEAIDLLDMIMAHRLGSGDLLIRARLAMIAGSNNATEASLAELAQFLSRHPEEREAALRGLALAESLPASAARSRLCARLRQLTVGGQVADGKGGPLDES